MKSFITVLMVVQALHTVALQQGGVRSTVTVKGEVDLEQKKASRMTDSQQDHFVTIGSQGMVEAHASFGHGVDESEGPEPEQRQHLSPREAWSLVESDEELSESDEDSEDEEEDNEEERLDTSAVGQGGPHADLAMAIPIVLVNLTNYSGLISTPNEDHSDDITFKFGKSVDADKALLFDNVHGFMITLRKYLGQRALEYCPLNTVPVIMDCLNMAMCLIQEDVTSTSTEPSMAQYALYEEQTESKEDQNQHVDAPEKHRERLVQGFHHNS